MQDKHLGYEYKDTEWTVPALASLFEGLKLCIKMERLCALGLKSFVG